MGAARAARRGRVRAPGDRGQAGAARRRADRARPRRAPPGCPSGPATSSSRSRRRTEPAGAASDAARARRGAPTTIWIGSGTAPDRRARADHVLWLDDRRPDGPRHRAVRAALPPAVGAHPRLLRAPGPADTGPAECTDEVCVTCSDEGRLGEVVLPPATAMARARPHRAGVEDVDVTLRRRRRARATWCWSTRARRSAGWTARSVRDREGEHQLPVSVPRRRGARRQDALLRRPRRVGRGPRPPRVRALRVVTLDAYGDRVIAAASRRWRAGSPRAGGCSRSATAAAPPTPPPWPRCSRARRSADPLPAWSLAADQADPHRAGQRRRLRAGLRPPAHRPRAGRATSPSRMSTSGNSDDLMAAFARGPQARHVHRRVRRATTAASSRRRADVDVCFTVRSQSVHRIQEAQALRRVRLWAAVSTWQADDASERHLTYRSTPDPSFAEEPRSSTASTRSAGVAPAASTTIVTLAHGAGGKSSAALVDAVFVEAFRNPSSSSSATAPCSHALGRAAGVLHRLVRGAAAAVPRRLDRPPRRARHRQRPRGVGRACRSGSRPRSCSRRASRSPSCATIVADMATRPRPRGRADRHRRHQGGAARARPTGCSSPPRASA